MQHRTYNHGFTLVEISIILVIIGLIVAGIVTGKSLIHTANINNAIAQLKNIKTATNLFQDRYSALPGDLPNATSYWGNITSNGNGDFYYQGSDEPKNNEGGYLWHHLSLSGIYKDFVRPDSTNFSFEYGVVTPEIMKNTAMMGSISWNI